MGKYFEKVATKYRSAKDLARIAQIANQRFGSNSPHARDAYTR